MSAALLILVALAVFSVLHSLTAGRSVKSAARRWLGERAYYGFYRIAYNMFSTLTLLPVLALVALLPGQVIWRADGPLALLLLLGLQLIGLIGLIIALIQIDLGQFTGLSQARAYFTGEPLPLPREPLQTGGVFRLVRHPLYLFSLLLIWPTPLMTESLLVFNIGATLYFIIGSRLEERRLREIFGDEYRNYQQRTPWLMPFLFGRRKLPVEKPDAMR